MKPQLSVTQTPKAIRQWVCNIAGFQILIAGMLTYGCESTTSPDTTVVEPGSFAISRIHTNTAPLQVGSGHISGQSTASFDLGNVDNTSDYYFVLTNAGDTDIEEITLETHHSGFTISPDFIEVLPPQNEMSLHQVLKLTITHGTSASGVGHAPLLEPGPLTAALQISGKTVNEQGDSLMAELKADLSVVARLSDLQIYSGEQQIDLSSPSGSVLNSRLYESFLRRYDVPKNDITVENTGNTELKFTAFKYAYPQFIQEAEFTLEPGNTATYSWPLVQSDDASMFAFVMDPGNIITDHKRLPIQNDGLVYIPLDGRDRQGGYLDDDPFQVE